MNVYDLYGRLTPHFKCSSAVDSPSHCSLLSIRAATLRAAQVGHLRARQATPLALHITSLVKHATKHITSFFDVCEEGDEDDYPFPALYCPELDASPPSAVDDARPIDKIHIGGPPELQTALRALVEEFEDIFSDKVRPEPALFPEMTLTVDESKWCVPSNRGPPRLNSPERNDIIQKKVDILLALKVIEPSKAAYYSHMHLVRKANTEHLPLERQLREVHDYRRLNDATTSEEHHPLPNIGEMLRAIGDTRPKRFTILDATSGYHQAPLAVASRPYTAFITQRGLYQYKRASTHGTERGCLLLPEGTRYDGLCWLAVYGMHAIH